MLSIENKKKKTCNCENDKSSNDSMNYLMIGGIAFIIYLIYRKKC